MPRICARDRHPTAGNGINSKWSAICKEQVLPSFKKMGEKGSSFEQYMQNAEFKINKSTLLIEACNAIDEMQISAQNQDVQGDLYEYLLSKLNTAGRAGQFRMPRHIIRPPLPEQERFAAIVARYERLRAQMRESQRQAELLFQGLLALSFTEGLHESFGGRNGSVFSR